MIRVCWVFFCVFALSTLEASGKLKWEFNYQKGAKYTYALKTNADFKFQHMSASSGYNGRLGSEIHRIFNIDATFDIDITKTSKNGDAEGLLQFTDFKFKIIYRADTPKELNGAKPSQATLGEPTEVILESEKLYKKKIKVKLPSKGGIQIKDALKEMSKLFGSALKKFEKVDRGFSKRYKGLLTGAFWQKFLSMHFLDPGSKKIPGKGKMDLEVFLGKPHSMVSSAVNSPCPIELVSLKEISNGDLELGVAFKVDIKEGQFNYTQLLTKFKPQLSFARAPEGHLKYAPVETWLANYSGNAANGDEYLIDMKSYLECKNFTEGMTKEK